jgi:1,4-dihydroxy-2-naphthoate octaprenyltransferase
MASRPRTLPAAVVPVMVGSALAVYENNFHFMYSLVALLCSLLIQIGTNFTNDLYDFVKGADTEQRKGPQRVLASGLVTVKEMKAAVFLTFAAAFFLGMYLVFNCGILILIIGIVSIIAGLAYTAGPYPLAYNGLGDIFVFIFFGVVGTMGTYYLHSHKISVIAFLISIPVGALITNILVVNNFRDMDEDKTSNKYTLAVKLGKTFTRYQFIVMLVVSFCIPIILFAGYNFHIWVLLPLVTLPLAGRLIKMLYTLTGVQLNKMLELTAKFSALFGLLFSFGIAL